MAKFTKLPNGKLVPATKEDMLELYGVDSFFDEDLENQTAMQEDLDFPKPEDGKPVSCVKCGELYNSAMPAISRIDKEKLFTQNAKVAQEK